MDKKIAATLLTIFLIPSVQAADLQTIKNNGYIRVGISGSKPPFGIMIENGDSVGFEAEIAKEISKDLFGNTENIEDKIFFEPVESVNRIPFLQEDKVDLVLANFTNTPARAKLVDFAKPYIKTQLGIVSPRNAEITDLSQLNGKTLAVVQGTTAEHYFDKHMPEVKLLRFAKNGEAFQKFREGKADALTQDNTLLFPWAEKNKDFVVGVEGFGEESFIAPAVQKGNAELLAFVNDEIKKMQTDGRMDAIYEETLQPAFGRDIKKETVLITEDKNASPKVK